MQEIFSFIFDLYQLLEGFSFFIYDVDRYQSNKIRTFVLLN